MKGVSRASFIIAIILAVVGVTFMVLGFIDINGTTALARIGNRYVTVRYSVSTSGQLFCLALITGGGFSLVSSILLFILSVITCPCRCKAKHGKPEQAPEAPKKEPKAETTEPAKAEPAAEPEPEPAAEEQAAPTEQA